MALESLPVATTAPLAPKAAPSVLRGFCLVRPMASETRNLNRWSSERYVRLYTRDSDDWLFLSFDAQALHMMLLRKADRAGVIRLSERHGLRGLAAIVGHPQQWGRIEPALNELLDDGCVSVVGDRLVFRDYIDQQEASQDNALRQALHRERVAAMRDNPSPAVTKSNQNQPDVTAGNGSSLHAVPAMPSMPIISPPDADAPPVVSANGRSDTSPALAVDDKKDPTTPPAKQPTLPGVSPVGSGAENAANGALGASASKPARPRKAKADGVPDEPDKTRYLDAFRAAFASPAADFTKDGLFAWRQLRVKHGIDVLLASVAGCAADPWTRANRGLEWVCSQAGVERGTRAPVAAPATDRYGKPDPTANVPRPALFVAPPPLTEEQKAASRAAMEKAKAERRIA